jgi:hypothetical protein
MLRSCLKQKIAAPAGHLPPNGTRPVGRTCAKPTGQLALHVLRTIHGVTPQQQLTSAGAANHIIERNHAPFLKPNVLAGYLPPNGTCAGAVPVRSTGATANAERAANHPRRSAAAKANLRENFLHFIIQSNSPLPPATYLRTALVSRAVPVRSAGDSLRCTCYQPPTAKRRSRC